MTKIRRWGGGVYNWLEFDFGRGAYQIDKVVYVRGSDITVELTWYNPLPFTNFSGTLTINGARLIVPTSPTTYENLGIEDDEIPFTCNAQSYQTISVTFTDVPNYVTYGDLQIDAIVTGNIGYHIPCGPTIAWGGEGWQETLWERVYLTYDEPTDMQEVPWTDLLEYGCKWAMGKDSADEVYEWVTYGLFWDSPWVYDPFSIYFWGRDDEYNYDEDSYWLAKALTSPSTVNMDCKDASGFNSLACQALGAPMTCDRVKGYNISTFWTNPLCGMGNDASVDEHPISHDPTYVSFPFGHHQASLANSLIYDPACAQRYNLSGDIYRQPPRGWGESGYWQTMDGDDVWGLVFGLPGSPSPTKQSITLDPTVHAIDEIN